MIVERLRIALHPFIYTPVFTISLERMKTRPKLLTTHLSVAIRCGILFYLNYVVHLFRGGRMDYTQEDEGRMDYRDDSPSAWTSGTTQVEI